mmetsp:Transcript_79223/g.201613  ORF Transcript_79223/g.201613 Transcript_79223/m.201613 type:complete len:380 (-) Transcript_79223:104-1243(-)
MADQCLPIDGSLGSVITGSIVWTCASLLIVKKVFHESPDRRWRDLVLDTSKQAIGGAWAGLISPPAVGCDAYLGGLLAETTVGTLVTYLCLVAFARLFERGIDNSKALRTGEYGNGSRHFVPGIYLSQVILWVASITAMKWAVPLFTPPFVAFGSIILEVFWWSGFLELSITALFAPCAMFGLQVWITDDFLKKAGKIGIFWHSARQALPRSIIDHCEKLFLNEEEDAAEDEEAAKVRAGPVAVVATTADAGADRPQRSAYDSYAPPLPAPPLPPPSDSGAGVGPLLPELPGTPRGAGRPPAGSPGGPWGSASPTFTAADSALAESSDQLREMKEALHQRELYLKGLQRQLEEVINSERTPRPSPEPSPVKHGAASGPE